MTDKQHDALRLADFLTSKYDLYEFSEQMQVAALLRTQHAELQQWKNVFGHLGTADECGNEWNKLKDDIERKDALLRQALEAFEYQMKPLCMCFAGCAECDPATAPNIDQIEYAIKQELSQ